MGAAGVRRQVQVPAEAAPPSPHGKLDATRIRRPFSFGYLLALLLSAPVLLLLPVVYLGIIALACYGTYYHTVEHVSFLEGRFIVGRVILYIGPIIGGVAIVLFMLKPLFARSTHKDSLFTLDRAQEPRFYDFVDRIAMAVGAPPPHIIEIECIPNAAAYFRHGLIGMLRRDLVLKVGVPLIPCMNSQQFAGVIAHELGHFSQGIGMSLTHLIFVINGWFARMVYVRDSWDERLDALGHVADNAFVWCTVAVARLCVWLVRRILWMLMMVARAVSCSVLRQMEFDADACEMAIAGSDVFCQTHVLIEEIDSTFSHVASTLSDLHAEGQLPDDLPRYVAATLTTMPPSVRQQLLERRATERTRLFDTHPASRFRIERARRLSLPGAYADTSPASNHFANFPLLSRWATLGFYRELMEFDDAADRLTPTSKMIERMHIERAGTDAANRLYKEIAHPLHFSFDDARVEAAMSFRGDFREQLRQVRQRFDANAAAAKEVIGLFNDAAEKWCDAASAAMLIRAKVRIKPAAFGLQKANLDEAVRLERKNLAEMDACAKTLRDFDGAVADRIGAALAVFAHETSRGSTGAAKLVHHAGRLREALRAIDDVQRLILDLTRGIVQINCLLGHADELPDEDALEKRFSSIAQDAQSGLRQLSAMLSSAKHPFAKGPNRMTIAQVVVTVPSEMHEVPPTVAAACGRLYDLRMQCLGRLALIVEKAERLVAANQT